MPLAAYALDGTQAFWDLKISKYVEYLTHVSSEHLISCMLFSLVSMAG
jgi:hypothetical protein